jgi:hypothetical protein
MGDDFVFNSLDNDLAVRDGRNFVVVGDNGFLELRWEQQQLERC